MGPLVPDIISNEFNFIIALIMGIGFGFALEQAGFSSTRKLVGLFYGYDFTVLKVFFTAGATAMIGILLLGHLGLLNLEYIFVNPFFVRSAIVGGLIMGAGFIIGGFCPGTSVCAAAIGKVDAMAFLFGSAIGVFAFMEAFPWLEAFYLADNQGAVLIFESLGMSRNMWALVLTIIAITAFLATSWIQSKVTGEKNEWAKVSRSKLAGYIAIPLAVVLMVMITPSRDEYVMAQLEERAASGECQPSIIDADKLAYELINSYFEYNIIDVRTKAEYDSFHIATAINIPLDNLAELAYRPLFRQRVKTNVFYASDFEDAKRACLLARFHGDDSGLALQETAETFQDLFFFPDEMPEAPTRHQLTVRTFREEAARKMEEIQAAVSAMSQPIQKKVRVVQGGCS
ncbi:YeeE/YedE thiosulfate transporter family protein [Geofilum rubicundum]|uniref:YeeE/YedE family protein n=1 Tax=Geofilum rubicundum JCM 15548 TaxID=1236989 RepID=A0A0E9LU46_9BACT|nr:YeeE/YedE thiosulfate transporter family protein [Geofilum rubicundum]GAO29097.1 YeeE/YedE family protein [Geofilum rubicundum JCM 15548]